MDRSQIIKAIQKDDSKLFTIRQNPINLKYVQCCFPINGEFSVTLIPNESETTYHDPTICQYSIIEDKPKSLNGLLEIFFQSKEGEEFEKQFKTIFFPRKITNTNVPLLFLSLWLDRFQCFQVLIKFIDSNIKLLKDPYQEKYNGRTIFLDVLKVEKLLSLKNPESEHKYLKCLLQSQIKLSEYEIMKFILNYSEFGQDFLDYYMKSHKQEINKIINRFQTIKYDQRLTEDPNGELFKDIIEYLSRQDPSSMIGSYNFYLEHFSQQTNATLDIYENCTELDIDTSDN